MSAIIEIEGLTKRYGNLVALDNLTLNVEQGTVVGFIGPNGAGKTTTIRILTTLLRPSSGQARIGGYAIAEHPQAVRRLIGYMPDFFGVYADMKVWGDLDFFAACYHIPAATRRAMVDDLLELVDLGHKKDEFVETLSRGMKQRLCLARTLAHDPQLLILDEPAAGLDPRARIEIRELLRELRRMGKTIFFSSHILAEVADVCDSIAVLEAGRLVAYGSLEEMQRRVRANRLIEARVLGDPAPLLALLAAWPGVSDLHTAADDPRLPADVARFALTGDDEALSRLLAQLVTQGVRLVSFREEKSDLEDVFMQVTRGIIG